MREFLRILMLAGILLLTSLAWIVLGAVMWERSDQQSDALHGAVSELWGQPHAQEAPTVILSWPVTVTRQVPVLDAEGKALWRDGAPVERTVQVQESAQRVLSLDSTRMDVHRNLDQRRKGLMWFPLYDVHFTGRWTVQIDAPPDGATLSFNFDFPHAQGVYDGFSVRMNDVEMADAHPPSQGQVRVPYTPQDGEVVRLDVRYHSRGMSSWEYRPSQGVAQLRDFQLALHTDFRDIDFPGYTLSPSAKTWTAKGWVLEWTFARLVTGHGMGMVMPAPVQPGPLAAALSFSAPISLGLFMLWVYVLGLLRGVDIHPVNHLFLAATFFSFHLLFGYTVDHMPVELAFALASAVSLVMTVSYLRLVAGPRFAWVEAGGAQLLYLVGFSLAHFWEGYTGLTVTVLGIATLFALGQLTGRIRWSEVFAVR